MAEEVHQHDTQDDRAARGEQFALFTDIEGLTDEVLFEISQACPVDELDPEICVPCRAFAMIEQRHNDALDAENAALNEHIGKTFAEGLAMPHDEEILTGETPTPKLDDLLAEEPGFVEFPKYIPGADIQPDALTVTNEPPPTVVEQFAAKVEELSVLVAELLHGPPIPPKDISTEELAALVVGATKWVNMIDAQGLELAPAQQAMKDTIHMVIRKVSQ